MLISRTISILLERILPMVVVMFATVNAYAELPIVPPPPDGDNIALGAPYTLSHDPNYDLCTDADDGIQLTDGSYQKNSPGVCFWCNSSAVGWYRQTPIEITIDLGKDQPIKGILFNTAGAAAADVRWPRAIGVLVSENGQDYYYAAELTHLSANHGLPTDQDRGVHTYWTDRMATHGRYVKVVVDNFPYLFVDEIAVFQGSDEFLSNPYQGNPISDASDYIAKSGLLVRQIVSDARALEKQTDQDTRLTAAKKKLLLSEIETIRREAYSLHPFAPETITMVLPMNELHARLFRAQAGLWQAQGHNDLTLWSGQTPWDPIAPTQEPNDDRAAVNITMMPGEFRSEAFNISNATNADLEVTVSITGLPDGANPDYVKLQQVEWTASALDSAVCSAITDCAVDAGVCSVSIPAGMTRQMWLTFNPTQIEPGRYSGRIVVDGGLAGTIDAEIDLRLSNIAFPKRPRLSLGGWDYTNTTYNSVTVENREAFIATLKAFFVDTTWATNAVMPWSQPKPTTFSDFDAWVDRWPDARHYRIYLNVPAEFNGYEMGSTEFDSAVAGWVSDHVAHWRKKGVDPKQVGLLLVDEPRNSVMADRVIKWAKAISAAEPDIQIWEDPIFSDPAEGAAMAAVCDVICPDRTKFIEGDETYRDKYRRQIDQGKQLEFYSCRGPVEGLDPYTYYRLQAWSAWKEGATAVSFWSFADQGYTTSWKTDYPGRSRFSPLYLEAQTVTEGKALFAIREGVEDYEYLAMLAERISEIEAAGNHHPLLEMAKDLLAHGHNEVLDPVSEDQMLQWNASKDRGLADRKRIEVLDMMERLTAPEPTPGEPDPTPSSDDTPDSPSDNNPPGSSSGACFVQQLVF